MATAEAQKTQEDAKHKAEELIRAAEVEAKARFLREQQEFDKKTAAGRDELREVEKRLDKRDDLLNLKMETLIAKEKAVEVGEAKLREHNKTVEATRVQVEETLKEQKTQLLRISGMSSS